MPMKAHKEENMNFKVKKAEAIYTGGGIYVYCGITEDGQHFMASDDPEWVVLTNEPTMTDEMTDEEWNDRWYMEWLDAHKTYETDSDEEGKAWLISIYNWLIANGESHYREEMKSSRDYTINELEKLSSAWKGYKMSNEKLMEYFVRINARLDANWTRETADEYDRIYNEILRRMEDFVDEPRRQ